MWSVGNKYTNDSATYGGSRAQLTPAVESLLDAVGRTGDGLRFGVEFFTFVYSAGNLMINESPSHPGHYLCWVNGSVQLPENVSFYMWVRVISGAISNSRLTYKNGEKILEPLIVPSDGWVYTSVGVYNTRGFVTTFPSWYCEPSSIIDIAMPGLFATVATDHKFTAPTLEI